MNRAKFRSMVMVDYAAEQEQELRIIVCPSGRRRTTRLSMANDQMTAEQRKELKHLCDKADVPDKSGELLSKAEAQKFIDDLKKQIAERGA